MNLPNQSSTKSLIQNNLKNIWKDISHIKKVCKRNSEKITLLAVSKNRSIEEIQYAIEYGQYIFGENYVQEGMKKINFFRKKFKSNKILWHFIGALQSNKSRFVAENFDWFQSIDRERIAYKLNYFRSKVFKPLNVLIQININNEEKKSGVLVEEIDMLASIIVNKYPRLKLRGLMSVPKFENDFLKQLRNFKKIYKLYTNLRFTYKEIDTLSIGMSNDFKAAIFSGSNLIRIGTSIFGRRKF